MSSTAWCLISPKVLTEACETETIPYAAFLPTLEDETLVFAEEEELPPGYRPGEIVL